MSISISNINPTLKLAVAGLMASMAFEPFALPIFLLPAFYILLGEVYLATAKQAFYSGFIFGFFHFISSLYWIGIALTSDIGNFLWLIPFAVLLIPMLLGIYVGLVCMLASFFRQSRLLFIIAFSVIWVIIEMVRGYIPVPFPWNFMGYVLTSVPHALVLAPLLGLHLCSLLVVFLASMPFAKSRSLVLTAYLLTILLIINLSSNSSKPIEFWDEVVRIVQPNLAEHHLGKPGSQRDMLLTISNLSLAPSNDNEIKAIIWPEASYPYLFRETDSELTYLSTLAPLGGYLITGADRIDSDKRLYNSIIAISSDGKIKSTYDKLILVPFGEYVPFSSLLPFVDKVAYGIYEFTPGTNYDRRLNNITLKYYPLVCYEVIFPIKSDLSHYEWLLNITNDAWFGNSSGPYQHFAMARFKAAEYGMPLIRVANTGISGVISPYGDVLESIPFNKQGILDVQIPKKVRIYALLRDKQNISVGVVFLICLCLNLAIIIKPLLISYINEDSSNK